MNPKKAYAASFGISFALVFVGYALGRASRSSEVKSLEETKELITDVYKRHLARAYSKMNIAQLAQCMSESADDLRFDSIVRHMDE